MKIDKLTFELGRTKCSPVTLTSCDLYSSCADSGGGGGPGQSDKKKKSSDVFLFFF